MYWHYLQKFSAPSFKRATGVYKEIFLELVDIVDSYKRSNQVSKLRQQGNFGYNGYHIVDVNVL